MANDGSVKIGVDFEPNKKSLDGLDKTLSDHMTKSRKTIAEYAKENNTTVEQVKKKIADLAAEYQKAGQTLQNSFKKAYADLGVMSEAQEKKLAKTKKAFKDVAEYAKENNMTFDEAAKKIYKIASEYQKAGDSQKEAIKKAYKQLGILTNEENKNAKSAEKMSDKTKETAKSTEKLGDESKAAALATELLGESLKRAGNLAGKASIGGLKAAYTTLSGIANFSASAFVANAKSVAVGLTTIGTAAAGLIGMGTAYNAEIEKYQTSFEVMTGSAEKASEIVETLRDMGASTPFELSDLAEATQLLMQFGFSADDAIDSMSMLGDISQGDAEKMIRIARAYGQMSSAGKVNLEDINQMIDAGFNPLQEIAESTGESMADLRQRITDGEMAVEEITAAFVRSTKEGGKYYQSMEKQSKTLSGQLSTLKDNFNAFAGEVASASIGDSANSFLPMLNTSLENLSSALSTGGLSGLASAIGGELSNFIAVVQSNLPDILDMGTSIMRSLVSGFILDDSDFKDAVNLLISEIPQFINDSLGTGYAFWSEFISMLSEGINQNQSEISKTTAQLISMFANFISKNAPIASEAAANLLSAIADGMASETGSIDKIFNSFSSAFQKNNGSLMKSGKTIANFLIKGISSGFVSVLDIFTDLIQMISYSIQSNADEFGTAVSEVINAIIGFIDQNLPILVNTAITLVKALVNGLLEGESFQLLVQAAVDIVLLIYNTVSENIGWIVEAALQIVNAIVSEMNNPEHREKITAAFHDLLIAIANAIGDNIDLLLDVAGQLLTFMTDNMLTPENIELIGDTMVELIQIIADKILTEENMEKLLETSCSIVKKLIGSLVTWVTSGDFEDFADRMFNGIRDAIASIDLASLGASILDGILSGLTGKDINFFDNIVGALGLDDKISGIFQKKEKGDAISAAVSPLSFGDSVIQVASLSQDMINLANEFKETSKAMQANTASNVTNNSSVDNSQKNTYNITNNNTFETPRDSMSWDEIAEGLEDAQQRNRKGHGR